MQYKNYYQVWPTIGQPRRMMQLHDLGVGGNLSPHNFTNEPPAHIRFKCGAAAYRVFVRKWNGYVETPMYFDGTHAELCGPCTCGATRGLDHEDQKYEKIEMLPVTWTKQFNFRTCQYEPRPDDNGNWRDFIPQNKMLLAQYDYHIERGRTPYSAACEATRDLEGSAYRSFLPEVDYRPPFVRAWEECYA